MFKVYNKLNCQGGSNNGIGQFVWPLEGFEFGIRCAYSVMFAQNIFAFVQLIACELRGDCTGFD